MKRLTDPKVVQNDLLAAQEDAARLSAALDALKIRETFRRRPSKAAFNTMLAELSTPFEGFDDAEKGFYLDALYQVTGINLPSPADYATWLSGCGEQATFDEETGRFVKDEALRVNDQPCWP
jgi:hypothetical protein